ncbi:hypothetical protein L1887_29723 [Cichorium endivia]|nr:hypothetical protein L1887_29723 [Cichorium endivia]
MDIDHNNIRRVVEEDRLSSLPDELIHKILSCFDMKFAVQTCLLSSRWECLWKSVPCLNFSSDCFRTLTKFSKFVTHVLSHRNHQIQVSSVKLDFDGVANQVSVRKIANYAFSHNVQELTVANTPLCRFSNFPPCLFSSQSLKHFALTVIDSSDCITLDTPLDFPALTTMHLSSIILSRDLFSKCVNLKNLTIEDFDVDCMEVLDIITPRLSNLMLIDSGYVDVINLIAPQLENLTVIGCYLTKPLNAPPGLKSFCCRGSSLVQLSKNGFHCLNKLTICLDWSWSTMSCNEKRAHKTINMLQELHTARYLTLSADVIECFSSFPYLLASHPSPFSNLISLTIDYSMKRDAYRVNMSSQAINFFLENSPNAKLLLELPKDRSRS